MTSNRFALDNQKALMAVSLGKKPEGHSAGAKNRKLAAYVGTGVSSCHEPIDLAQTLERLRMGVYVMVREGGVRKDLTAISTIRNMDVGPSG